MSKADFDIENENAGCFQRQRVTLKRKHSEMDGEKDDFKSHGNKSIFTSLKEKLGFKSSTSLGCGNEKGRKSILSPLRTGHDESGEHNFSHGFSSFASTPLGANHSSNHPTNRFNIEEIPRKRVKFDEENLIVSSITYQRQNANPPQKNETSLLSKFINFTANLF